MTQRLETRRSVSAAALRAHLIGLTLAALALLLAPNAGAAFPGRNGSIVFSNHWYHEHQIYWLRPGLRLLTRHTRAFHADPSVSPSGKRIVFQRGRHSNAEIYSIPAKGGHERRLTDNATSDLDPRFSGPSGDHVIFSSDRQRPGNYDLYVMRSDGSHVRRVAGGPGNQLTPTYSPDGRRIAYSDDRTGKGDIYVMQANGRDKQRLTVNSSPDTAPDFSPDGSLITFTRKMGRPHRGHADIYLMRADGTHERRVTLRRSPWISGGSVFSPNGRKIAYQEDFSITVINVDGSHRHLLLRGGVNSRPSWGVKR